METPPAPKHIPQEEHTEENITEKPVTTDTTDKPLTIADLRKYDAEREAKMLESSVIAERRDISEKYAADHNIKDDEFTKLVASATALYNANDDWEYTDALDAARRALYPSKGNPSNIQGRHAIPSNPQSEEPIDLGKKGYTLDNWF